MYDVPTYQGGHQKAHLIFRAFTGIKFQILCCTVQVCTRVLSILKRISMQGVLVMVAAVSCVLLHPLTENGTGDRFGSLSCRCLRSELVLRIGCGCGKSSSNTSKSAHMACSVRLPVPVRLKDKGVYCTSKLCSPVVGLCGQARQ